MKRGKFLIYVLGLLLIFPFNSYSKEQSNNDIGRLRKKYIHLSYGSQKYSSDDDLSIKSKYGLSFTTGKSFYLHKKPVAKCLYFAIDATWFDFSYYAYNSADDIKEFMKNNDDYKNIGSIIYSEIDDMFGEKNHQFNIGMQIGPSIHIHPYKGLHIETYFRYAPTYSLMYNGDILGNYATYFVGGGAVSWKFIGVGAEAKFGNCKYKMLVDDDDEISNERTKFKGFNVYLSFRF